jgi:hypothetical protein
MLSRCHAASKRSAKPSSALASRSSATATRLKKRNEEEFVMKQAK